MKVKVNSDIHELVSSNQLAHLMRQLHLEEKGGIAVAVNEVVIPKKEWHQFELKENDQIIIIEAAQGG